MTLEHFDVLVIGAGLSGVGAGYRLQTQCPGKTYAILEGRSAMGGTWDLFRYPGIRSDSDMFTLGYPFRPWTDPKSIADGPSILKYIHETAEAYGIDRHIRYDTKVVRAAWSSETSTWTVEVTRGADAEPASYTCSFLYMCSGYYSYDGGYTPDFPGLDDFQGTIVHPQQWPEDLDYTDKRVVVIGSGATAVTLVPSMADDAAMVTMLQRSPTYVLALPGSDPLANFLRRHLPEKLAYRLIRWNNVAISTAFYQLCRRRPALGKKILRKGTERLLPKGYPVDPDFTPKYNPWDQRLCVVPDADLFKAIRKGTAEVVTDTIDTFTADGIDLTSGRHLPADIVVTATGLKLVACGGIRLEVDGAVVDPGECVAYKGHMLSGVPNAAMCVGYTNASWTLRADITTQAVCRLLNEMDEHGYTKAVPTLDDTAVSPRPILDLTSGYVQRGLGIMPKQGEKSPWSVRQNYLLDYLSFRFGKPTDSITFGRTTKPAAGEPLVTEEPEPVRAS